MFFKERKRLETKKALNILGLSQHLFIKHPTSGEMAELVMAPG